MNNRVFIIAEAGVNHNGSVDLAKQLIDVASNSGADAVKFQTFKAENLVSKNTQKAEYQKQTTNASESQFDMIKKLELDVDTHKELITYCQEKNIMFLSTPFDHDSIDLLESLDFKIYKIPSGEITNLPYLKYLAKLKKKLILSTGMSKTREISTALNILKKYGTKTNDISLLHCNSSYPAPYEDVNLKAMVFLKKKFNLKIGLSDHSLGIEVPIAAVALGAEIIEKHFTLSRNMIGPDHKSSIEPQELSKMVKSIRKIELALGSECKKITKSEIKNINIVRKSIVAKKFIAKGELFTLDNLAFKRPGFGISPMYVDRLIGKTAKKNYKKDSMIK